jgi:hypothetical protein
MSTVSAGNFHEFSRVLPKDSPPHLIAAVEDATRDTLARHGVSAFAAPREAAIFHEVGHAIVGAHEGFKIRNISIYSRAVPNGLLWSGRCVEEAATWTTGPDTSADDDLRRARFIIAGLAGEAITGKDKPGSSLDELGLSQLVGLNAAAKLDDPTLSDAEAHVYAQRLWHEQVWGVAVAILRNNREPFMQLAKLLHERERVKGGKLHKILDQVKRVADPIAVARDASEATTATDGGGNAAARPPTQGRVRELVDWYKDETYRRYNENRLNSAELDHDLRDTLIKEVPPEMLEAVFTQIMDLALAV